MNCASCDEIFETPAWHIRSGLLNLCSIKCGLVKYARCSHEYMWVNPPKAE